MSNLYIFIIIDTIANTRLRGKKTYSWYWGEPLKELIIFQPFYVSSRAIVIYTPYAKDKIQNSGAGQTRRI